MHRSATNATGFCNVEYASKMVSAKGRLNSRCVVRTIAVNRATGVKRDVSLGFYASALRGAYAYAAFLRGENPEYAPDITPSCQSRHERRIAVRGAEAMDVEPSS